MNIRLTLSTIFAVKLCMQLVNANNFDELEKLPKGVCYNPSLMQFQNLLLSISKLLHPIQ